ncbi:MAG: hypothetical protein IKE60_02540 [Reyranella sp.]|uniref:hypothetical protein n=1 Tax=Reyranella sp. TaxID=1929291 RepID=UPI0025CE943B|nr:hypothetical protein [Reyranella sp.]MBR2813501.1 hypothetical protein [Reyranella sp.]
MSAMYEMQYQGVAGGGHGAIYIGKGKIVGIDVTGARYSGTYTNGQTLSGSATLTSAGGVLVTGAPIPPGTKVPITFANLPLNLGNGQFVQVSVGGNPVNVAFHKIDDIP